MFDVHFSGSFAALRLLSFAAFIELRCIPGHTSVLVGPRSPTGTWRGVRLRAARAGETMTTPVTGPGGDAGTYWMAALPCFLGTFVAMATNYRNCP